MIFEIFINKTTNRLIIIKENYVPKPKAIDGLQFVEKLNSASWSEFNKIINKKYLDIDLENKK